MKEQYEELMFNINVDESNWDELDCQSLDLFGEYFEEIDHERAYGNTRDD